MAKNRRVSLLRRMLTARGRSLEITKSGWLFILLTLAVGFAAINSGSNLLHALFGAQMALIVGSGVLSEATVRRARARRAPTGAVHVGAPAPLSVELHNTDRRALLLSVSVEDDDRVATADKCEPVFAVSVPAGKSLSLPSSVTMRRRGRQRLPPAVVATRFPFGFFVKRRELPKPAPIVVYPRVNPVELSALDGARLGQGDAAGRVARVGEFYGLREYREGDDPRRIYWPAAARLPRPVVREHESNADQVVMLDLAPGTTGDPPFESEVERVASIAVAHLRRPGTAVGLRYAGQVLVVPGSGADHRHRLLEALALVGGDA